MTRADKYRGDQAIEAGVAQFLDENFYAKLNAPTQRWSDREHQFAGVDVTVKGVAFDEKVKVRGCLNSVCECPSFEVSLVNRAGSVQDGWFVRPLSTAYYAFIGVYSYGSDENALSDANAISACDVLWVSKRDVYDLVESETGMQRLKNDARELREDPFVDSSGKGRTRYPHRKFWLTYSSRLAEQPVNLVVPRKTLERLPHTRRIHVTREGAKTI